MNNLQQKTFGELPISKKHRKHFLNEVNLDHEFSLSPGQSTTIAEENLTIKFIEVTSDGRCPKGAICIWPGEANCLIEITKDSESSHRIVLTQLGLSRTPKIDFANYKIRFDLQPYPEVGKASDKKGYNLQLVISKKPAPRG
jgi:hypothetical protein